MTVVDVVVDVVDVVVNVVVNVVDVGGVVDNYC
jgi:hypothetical protein